MIKNKFKFYFFIFLYILCYLYLCIYSGLISNGVEVGDTIIGWLAFIFDFIPFAALNISTNIYIWIFLSFFLLVLIFEQTRLNKQRRNREALICMGINLWFTIISDSICLALIGKPWLEDVFVNSLIFILLIGIPILIVYIFFKKRGLLNSYSTYKDIMTEEEFERWQIKKKYKQRR